MRFIIHRYRYLFPSTLWKGIWPNCTWSWMFWWRKPSDWV